MPPASSRPRPAPHLFCAVHRSSRPAGLQHNLSVLCVRAAEARRPRRLHQRVCRRLLLAPRRLHHHASSSASSSRRRRCRALIIPVVLLARPAAAQHQHQAAAAALAGRHDADARHGVAGLLVLGGCSSAARHPPGQAGGSPGSGRLRRHASLGAGGRGQRRGLGEVVVLARRGAQRRALLGRGGGRALGTGGRLRGRREGREGMQGG